MNTNKRFLLNLQLFMLLLFGCMSCVTEIVNTDGDSGVPEKVYVINNAQFGIRSDKTNARATNDGINAAIRKAKKEGYNVVKLTAGDYLIVPHPNGYEHEDGIYVPSFMTLDLTDAKLYIEPNGYTEYTLIRLHLVENVTIVGGHLIGDKDEHDYTTIQHTHEFGCGIQIISSRNITIKDMKIERMTGDAMIMDFHMIWPTDHRLSRNIKVLNCEMSHCRRQGISICHARDVEVAYNKIHDIGGTSPGAGIDIEPGGGENWHSTVDRVNIHHNEFYDIPSMGVCIVSGSTTDIEVADNYFKDARVVIDWWTARIRVVRNTMTGNCGMAARICTDVYMPIEGPNKNTVESTHVTNCSRLTGYIKETDNHITCPPPQ